MPNGWIKFTSLHCKSKAFDDVYDFNSYSCRKSSHCSKDVIDTRIGKKNLKPDPKLRRLKSCRAEPELNPPTRTRRSKSARTSDALTELPDGHPSRNVVEIIFQSSWSPDEFPSRVEMIYKVENGSRTVTRFEEYRETVKIRASKLQKKHPRCLADGNELLRFHGTTVACGLGINGSTSLCTAEKCCVCRIIRNGFSAKREKNNGVGVFTASTSGRAFESILVEEGDGERTVTVRKVLIVCRVIAGRVHRPVENVEEMNGLMMSGFDSLAGKVGLYTNVEELYLLNPRALLPCFVVICKS